MKIIIAFAHHDLKMKKFEHIMYIFSFEIHLYYTILKIEI